jgi:hypothetical protein
MMYVDANGAAQFMGAFWVPQKAISVNVSSGNVANASAAAAMPADAARINYITGFEVTASGSTAGLAVTVTVAGILGGTMSYTFVAPVGVLVPAQPLVVEFPDPIPASAINTAITVTCPALGSGNTNATVNVHGYKF